MLQQDEWLLLKKRTPSVEKKKSKTLVFIAEISNLLINIYNL